MPDHWSRSRVQAVVGASWRLRGEATDAIAAAWPGPVKRSAEPDDLPGVLLGLDTPSLFEPAALHVVRASLPWLRRHKDALAAAIAPCGDGGGALLLSLGEIDGRDALSKALAKAEALHAVDAPDGKALAGWLGDRLTCHPQGVDRPRAVAEALIARLGEDVDALIAAIDVVAAVDAVVGGVGERPIWEFTGAILDGNAARALALLYAGGGLEPAQAAGAFANELRKLIACCDAGGDDEAARLAGMRGRTGALFYARKRARDVGKTALVRLMTGAYQCQRQLRQSGYHAETAVELLVLHAQRVIRPQGR